MNRVLVASPDLRPSLRPVLAALVEAGERARLVTLKVFDPTQRFDRIWPRLLPDMPTAHRRVPDWLAGQVDSIVPAERLRVALGRLHPYLGHRLWLENECEEYFHVDASEPAWGVHVPCSVLLVSDPCRAYADRAALSATRSRPDRVTAENPSAAATEQRD